MKKPKMSNMRGQRSESDISEQRDIGRCPVTPPSTISLLLNELQNNGEGDEITDGRQTIRCRRDRWTKLDCCGDNEIRLGGCTATL